MDKKSIALLLIASSFASSVFATSVINKIITKHSPATSSISKTHKTIKQTNPLYTDFSGTWNVNCGDGSIETTVIENDANYITVDGVEYRIGQGLQGSFESNEKNAMYDYTSFEWNGNGSGLAVKQVGVSKDNIDHSAIVTDIGMFTLTMKNGQINLDGKLTIFEDITQLVPPNDIHCVLSKKL